MTTGASAPPALLGTRDPALTEAVLATAVALGVQVEVVQDRDELRRGWAAAPVRLLGSDMAARAAVLERLAGTYVVGVADQSLLAASAQLRAPALALPDATAELADVLAGHLQGESGGLLLAVVGASGGLGVSSLVVGLATVAAAAGTRSAAVELAECGGGLDLLFGAETREGLRWDGLGQAQGQLGDLDGHLLSTDGVDVLALDRRRPAHPDAAAVAAVLGSLARTHGAVFIDAGSAGNARLDAHGTQTLLVVGADVASVASARMVVERRGLESARLVVRSGPGRTLPAEAVAESLGMGLLGEVRHDKALLRLAQSGGSVASAQARRFRRDAQRLWEGISR
nr:septum site-determining protein Ssd [Tessaracoccus sp. OS52]